MAVHQFPNLYLVRDPQPVASYIRPAARDYRNLGDHISAGLGTPTGVILDTRAPDRILDLLSAAHSKELDIVLDPLSIELSTAGGFARAGIPSLPWAAKRPHRPTDFSAEMRQQVVARIAQTATEMGATAVLAPTHILDSDVSGWLPVDFELTAALRSALDADGGSGIAIYYPLVARLQTLAQPTSALNSHFEQLTKFGAVDAIWLRAAGYDVRDAGPTKIKRYVSVARALHTYGVPVIGERTGTFGVALAAFGAVAGLESGIASGQRYIVHDLLKIPKPTKTAPKQPLRVYLPSIGAFMNRANAESFLKHPAVKNWFTCQDRCCEKGGAVDMIAEPRRHFLVSRASEISRLASTPPELRAANFLEHWLRPASDRATRAARVAEELRSHRDRIDSWRVTFSEIYDQDQITRPTLSTVVAPKRHNRGA